MAALARPERVLSLSLYEPVLFSVLFQDDPAQPAAREIAAVSDDTGAALQRGDAEGSSARFIDYWMGAGTWENTPPKRRAGIVRTIGKIKDDFHAAFTEKTPLSAFSGLPIHTLFMVGSTSPASSLRIARLLTGTLPRVETVEIRGAGHMGPITHADAVNAAIEAHLDGIGG
jgi:pimeloyl-ACP methyl ester carboxylesterase